MKLRMTLMATIITIVCLLAGCASDEQSNTGYSKVDPHPSETVAASVEGTEVANADIPMKWEQTLEFGSLV